MLYRIQCSRLRHCIRYSPIIRLYYIRIINWTHSKGVGEAVSKLLKNGANPNVKDDTGQAALHHVIWQLRQSRTTEELKGYEECLDALLDLNKSISTEKLDLEAKNGRWEKMYWKKLKRSEKRFLSEEKEINKTNTSWSITKSSQWLGLWSEA